MNINMRYDAGRRAGQDTGRRGVLHAALLLPLPRPHVRASRDAERPTPVRARERPGLGFARQRGLARTLPRRRTAAHARIETALLRGLKSRMPSLALLRTCAHAMANA